MLCGGYKPWKEIESDTEEAHKVAIAFKEEIQTKFNANFSDFKPHSYQTQVVAGTNYKVKILVDGGEVIQLKVYRALPHMAKPD